MEKEMMLKFLSDKPEVDNVILYGSMVAGKSDDPTKQLDGIITVQDKKLFHMELYKEYPEYYPFKLGYEYAKHFNGIKCMLDYLVYLPFDERFIKLGIIATDDFKDNLKSWKDFPTAGRMHKYVEILKDNSEIDIINYRNRLNAFKYNLLLIQKGKISVNEMFLSLIKMSYLNTFREVFHLEKKDKSLEILSDNYQFFRDTYLDSEYGVVDKDIFIVDIEKLLSDLVDEYTPDLLIKYLEKYSINGVEKFLKNNFISSTELIVKGTLLNGISKTNDYKVRKRKKYLES